MPSIILDETSRQFSSYCICIANWLLDLRWLYLATIEKARVAGQLQVSFISNCDVSHT